MDTHIVGLVRARNFFQFRGNWMDEACGNQWGGGDGTRDGWPMAYYIPNLGKSNCKRVF